MITNMKVYGGKAKVSQRNKRKGLGIKLKPYVKKIDYPYENVMSHAQMYRYLMELGYKFDSVYDPDITAIAINEKYKWDSNLQVWYDVLKVEEVKEEPIKEDNIVETPKDSPLVQPSSAPKPKRFATYEEAFGYFLHMINYHYILEDTSSGAYSLHRTTEGRAQRRWLKDIVLNYLTSFSWMSTQDEEGNNILVPATEEGIHSEIYSRHKDYFSIEEIANYTKWEVVDNELRLIAQKKSVLSRSLRDFCIKIFEWVDHFVAKEEEEITMSLNDIIKSKE